ncbi:DUF2691 family protein [Ruminococcus sp. zg-921]|uniref:DUF2691 family protein n=1 Tax=Ruminococcus sp. zg-921 TaxID=2678506 RepID=UPI002108E9A6|nr:DUF2691 family protein [Ruminococcus sp. zg-921]MCQ4114245.1 DUF2691 family protein [Ruminococcus sp. zg-921]
MRGISFKITNHNNILYQILNCIDIKKYVWYNIENQNESWENTSKNDLFDSSYYDGENFLKCIQSNHFVVFLKLQAYFENCKFFDIHTYNDFIKSDCQLILLVYDCSSVEIYSKDVNDITAIYNNALKNNYLDINFITDNNDMRKTFDLL